MPISSPVRCPHSKAGLGTLGSRIAHRDGKKSTAAPTAWVENTVIAAGAISCIVALQTGVRNNKGIPGWRW
jgi:hypothetical protein